MNNKLGPIISSFGKGLLVAILSMAELYLLSSSASGQQANSIIHTGAPPAWVKVVEPVLMPAKPDQETGGQVFDLIDTQVNVAGQETYLHVIKEITTQAGVETGANLKFSWDPTFQELILHRIAILRGKERIDRLDTTRFKVIQQETDLDQQIYNGALSAVLFLEDVRVGDRIEYEYTLRGQNPSLNGRYSDSLLLGLPRPVQHRRVRVQWPEERQLRYALHSATTEPEIMHHEGIKEYLWDLHQVPAVVVEDQIPSWFFPYPCVQLSEFTNWSEVAAWAVKLFVTTNADAPELQQVVNSLKKPGLTAEETVQRTLEFVQKEVRYLGIEFGENSYRPTDPVMVLRQRFGDCKDKALLLCSLLQKLGYEATPVLVATGFRQALPKLLPAPSDFDHVIVRVVAAGKTYWLDPTRSFQRGPIAQRYEPSYSFGLLVTAGVTSLTQIPKSDAGAPYTITKEVFHVGGQKSPTQLSVTTICKGYDAEWMRAVLNGQGRERLAKSYLNDYAQRYPGTVPAAPLRIEDSTNSDTLTLIEAYVITNFWVRVPDKQFYKCEFYPLEIHTWIEKPSTSVRMFPMELSFPRRRLVQTRIELPREFKLSNLTNTIVGPAAELRVNRTVRGQTVWLNYEYTALTNFVPASLASKHLDSLDRMEDALGYALHWQSMEEAGKTSQFNWPLFLLAVFYAILFTSGAGILCHRQCNRPVLLATGTPPLLQQKLNGLGGWLILVCFGLIVGPIRLLANMGQSIGAYSLWRWHAVTNPSGMSYHPLWKPLLTFELLGQISILILDIFVLVLFFQKRRVLPRWFIALLILNAMFVLGDTVGVRILGISSPASLTQQSRNIMSVLFGCSIWIPYMLVSQRVKATFVR